VHSVCSVVNVNLIHDERAGQFQMVEQRGRHAGVSQGLESSARHA
jgi:hypothetical protein